MKISNSHSKILLLLLVLTITLASCAKDSLDAVRAKLPPEFQYLAGIFDGDGVGSGFTMGPVTILFNLNGDKYAWVEDGVIRDVRTLNDSLSLFQDDVLESVGAVMVSFPKYVYLFDRNGSRFVEADLDARIAYGQWDNPNFFSFNTKKFTLRDWSNKDSSPFSTIGAIWCAKTDRNCGPYTLNSSTYLMSNGSGNLFTDYNGFTGKFGAVEFVNQYEMYECGNLNEENDGVKTNLLPLTNIDAVIDYLGPDQKLKGELFFFSEGKQFGYNEFGTGSFKGPYDLY
ncbi:MAG: hypothetical protein KDC57_06330 [Saprospiraceae bacterium]|nr:hypothetical protein [Saprospiraceae bacterium]